MKTQDTLNAGLISFIKQSPNAFFATAQLQSILDSAGFTQLKEEDIWSLKHLSNYYVIRGESSLIAFCYRDNFIETGIKMVGAHSDSPAFKVKPNPDRTTNGTYQLMVEPYGGMIISSWFDRDLSLAGKVNFIDTDGNVQGLLLDFKRPIASIPNLAIHMNREINSGYKYNKQSDVPPVLMQLSGDETTDFNSILISEIKKQKLSSTIAKVLTHEMYFYDTQSPAIIGLNQDYIVSARLDNLLSSYLGVEALISSKDQKNCSLFIANDHEEIGSSSFTGAGGSFLSDIVERITKTRESFFRTIANSFLISSDNAHAIHPNFKSIHEPNHQIELNKGPAIKINSSIKYATNGETMAKYISYATKAEMPYQVFVMRSDLPCGSTIGPITSARLGIKTLDIGVPTWGMHSIRETAGTKDTFYLYKTLIHFFKED